MNKCIIMDEKVESRNNIVVGFIMDGNRRWAEKNNVDLMIAYERGSDTFLKVILTCIRNKVSQAIFYALSYDNYIKRASSELQSVFDSGISLLEKKKKYFIDHKIKILFIGSYNLLSKEVQKIILDLEAMTCIESPVITIFLLFMYNPFEDVFCGKEGRLKYSYNVPNIDLIIRTGGRNRLSGFLPIQSMYANIICLDEFWPDLSIESIENAILKKFINNFGN